MTTPRLPTFWATNDDYSTGPDTGTPTKVDPASAANGFIKGVIAAPQHVNYHLNALALAARRAASLFLAKPRTLSIVLDDTSGDIAVVSQGSNRPVVIGTLNSNGTPVVAGCDPIFEAGAVASITSLVRGGAMNPSSGRIVLVGTGGNRSCFSDNGGGSWSAGGDLGGSGVDCVYNVTHSRFVATYSGHIRYSADAAAWTDVTVSGAGGGNGMGVLPNGDMYHLTASSPVVLSVSTNGGTSWGAAGTSVPNAADLSSRGWITGRERDYLYHAALRTSTGNLQISRSSDGVTWSVIATLAPPGADAITSTTRIAQCPDTGVLFVLGTTNPGGIVYNVLWASVDGTDWTDPILVGTGASGTPPFVAAGMGAADGRVFLASNVGGLLLASDGLGAV